MTEYGQPSWWICPVCDSQQSSSALVYDEDNKQYLCFVCLDCVFNCSTWKRAD